MTPRNTPYRKPSRFAPRQDRWAVHKMNLYAKGDSAWEFKWDEHPNNTPQRVVRPRHLSLPFSTLCRPGILRGSTSWLIAFVSLGVLNVTA